MITPETGLYMDAQQKAEVIAAVRRRLEQMYVFPEVARQVSDLLGDKLAGDGYDQSETADAFMIAVTTDMQSMNGDRHLRLQKKGAGGVRLVGDMEEMRRVRAADNFGFHKVERMAGNVGYLNILQFDPPSVAADTGVAAMNYLANTEALIVDLRQCKGGSPQMVALVLSYLFDVPVHLNSFYNRMTEGTTQSWTLPYVPGRRYGSAKPVYVLTSNFTFSAGEEFAYDLQTRKRAVVVGETTGGGAHPGQPHPINELFDVFVPSGRAINPVTGTNWEGVGVQPDIAVPNEEALTAAYQAALLHIREGLGHRTGTPFGAEVERALRQVG